MKTIILFFFFFKFATSGNKWHFPNDCTQEYIHKDTLILQCFVLRVLGLRHLTAGRNDNTALGFSEE